MTGKIDSVFISIDFTFHTQRPSLTRKIIKYHMCRGKIKFNF